jgi:hypothetical protein
MEQGKMTGVPAGKIDTLFFDRPDRPDEGQTGHSGFSNPNPRKGVTGDP